MRENRRAVAFLGQQHIERMLALPEGVRVLAVRDDFQRCGVSVLVEGDALEPVDEGCVLPDLPVGMSDPSVLAMRAEVWGGEGSLGDIVGVDCPLVDCPWSEHWIESRPTLGMLADAVQQHIIEAHAGEQS